MTEFDEQEHQSNDPIFCAYKNCPTPKDHKQSICPLCKRSLKEVTKPKSDDEEIMPYFSESEFNRIFGAV